MFVTDNTDDKKVKESEFQSLIGLCDVCDSDFFASLNCLFRFQSLIGLCDVCDFSSKSGLKTSKTVSIPNRAL